MPIDETISAIADHLASLKATRNEALKGIAALNVAIAALESVFELPQAPPDPKPEPEPEPLPPAAKKPRRRKMSAAGRARIAKAAKAVWRRRRQEAREAKVFSMQRRGRRAAA